MSKSVVDLQSCQFAGDEDIRLVGDIGGPEDGPLVILQHGGGQTRHSWRRAFYELTHAGFRTISLDARGHGESDWSPSQDYRLECFASDLERVLSQQHTPAVVIGASMGGISALALFNRPYLPNIKALILVDITPQVNSKGAKRIGQFMSKYANGFESLEEVADAISEYRPGRLRPANLDGLSPLVRKSGERLYWHWDPQFISSPKRLIPIEYESELERAASRLDVPTLLIRGMRSDVVGQDESSLFLERVPHAEFVEVHGSGHMVSGDKNDAFNAAILDFLERVTRTD